MSKSKKKFKFTCYRKFYLVIIFQFDMALKMINIDKSKRFAVKKKECKRLILKYLINNVNLHKKIRWKFFLKLQGFSKSTSSVGLVRRCVYTGRKYSVNKNLRLNRLEIFRRLKLSSLPGYLNLSRL